MKILYGIQGTGNGHISKAETIYPLLKNYGEVDVLISASNYSLKPSFPVKFKMKGISFSTSKGKIKYWSTLKNIDHKTFLNDINSIPFNAYDLVVSDFEPITAWGAKKNGVKSLQISHQAAFHSIKSPRPFIINPFAEVIMKYFAPTNDYIGLHFKQYSKNISEPIIKKSLFNIKTKLDNHITVYLPWQDDKIIINLFSKIKDHTFHVFSPNISKDYSIKNVEYKLISNQKFVESLTSCYGVICNAGFETPSEALHLGKRLIVIPQKRQYEQKCNAIALKNMGVPTIKKLNKNSLVLIKKWLESKPKKITFNCSLELMLKNKMSQINLK
tara:strand:+ start:746 stop:1732 length:987 start_codon:yes stop_codon:yes gene_type:complete